MAKPMTTLLNQLEAQGFDVKPTKSCHYSVRKNGEFVTVLASTPSEYRGWLNSITRLRRAGFVDPKRKTR